MLAGACRFSLDMALLRRLLVPEGVSQDGAEGPDPPRRRSRDASAASGSP